MCCRDEESRYDDRALNWARLWERVISSTVNLVLTGIGLGLLLLAKELLL